MSAAGKPETTIRVFRADAKIEGGCNACARISEHGKYLYRRVVVVKLRSLVWRVCDQCLEALMPQLEDVRQ